MTKLFKGLLTGASLLALAPAVQAADQLSYAGGWPPGSGPTGALENYAEAVGEASGGELTMRVFPLSLLSFAESNAGLRDGLADLSTILTPYFSAEFPNLNMISEFSEMVELADFSGELSSLAFAGAVSEYVMLNCDNCQEEVAERQNILIGMEINKLLCEIISCQNNQEIFEESLNLAIGLTLGKIFWIFDRRCVKKID